MQFDALIVGAGFYGAVVANRLAERGAQVLVIDRRPHIAGNAYTEDHLDVAVHMYGAHIFHTSDEQVWDFARKYGNFNHYVNSPIADYHGEIYNLPFNMNTFAKLFPGVRTPDEARARIAAQAAEAGITGEPKNLEEQALSMVGREIYEKLIKGYTEKQWGRPCNELPAFILKRVPLRFIYDNNYFYDPHQGIPVEGYTGMVKNLLEEKLAGSITVRLNTDYFDLVTRGEDGLPVRGADGFALAGGDTAKQIVYTGPIDAFFNYCLGELSYRSLRFEHEELPETENYQGNAVVNYTAAEVPYTRVIEHKHFVFGKQPGTVITREYPEAWTRGAEPYYPVNDDENNARSEEYRALGEKLPDVLFGGRLGTYRYYNLDQVMGQALRDAEKLAAK